jgi:REP element-mobilizing transposase RayT
MNRGVARRTVFEHAGDIRRFQALLARVVRDRKIEVHAFAFLTTHFHLLVRSISGELSPTLRWVERQYVGFFNRTRRRDGPLFRGRYRSRRVAEGQDLRNVVHYIDQNAITARLTEDGTEFPFASAWHYGRSSGPVWLARDVIEGIVCEACGVDHYDPRLYDGVFGVHLAQPIEWLVERRLRKGSRHDLVSADLLARAPAAVREWMERKARTADGTRPGVPMAAPAALMAQVDGVRSRRPDWTVRLSRCRKPALPILAVGLLRTVCGLRLTEIGMRRHLAVATVHSFIRYHAQLIVNDPDYGAVAAACVRGAIGAKEHS